VFFGRSGQGGADLGRKARFVGPVGDRGPAVELLVEAREVAGHVGERPEVRDRQRAGFPSGDAVDGGVPRLDVDVRRRRRRQDRPVADAHARDVAREHDAAARVPVGDVVDGVAGRPGPRDPVGLAGVIQNPHVGRGDRDDPAPQPLHRVAVDARRACDEAAGVDHVPGPVLMDPDLQPGPALDQRAGGARVVEVDVGQQDAPRRLVAELLEQGLDRGLRARVDDVAIDHMGADGLLGPLEADVDLAVGGVGHAAGR
jgi:hypothetical protein